MLSWRDRNKAGQCLHGVCIAHPCPECAAEGYVRCPACLKLFVPEDGKRHYCNTYCRNVAAHRRERAREEARGMA